MSFFLSIFKIKNMVTVVYCTRQTNPEYKEHLIKSSGLHKHLEIIEIVNNGESLTKCYNRGLKQAKNDIVVFCHDDISFETNQWGNKLLKQFSRHPDYGIIGVAGTKNLPTSGKWWENRKKMYGQVEHTHEGKTWLTVYSPNMGLDIEEVVVIDGLFMAIDKTKIKSEFDETVEGFHFYDISFCFDNYLKGVKLGVITAIKINHKSIGMTNKDWEANRLIFSEKHKDVLPVNIKKVMRKGEKLKVLIACLNLKDNSIEQTHILDLVKQLVKQNCDISISSNIDKKIGNILSKMGVKIFSLHEPPGFKLGDGKWLLKSSTNEQVVSQPNTLYKIKDINFDVLHISQKPVADHLLRLYPDTSTICSINTTDKSLDEPVINPQIKKYLAMTEEIKEVLVDGYGIDSELVEVVNKQKEIIEDYKLILS